MSFTTVLAAGLVLALGAGVAASLLAPRPAPRDAPARRAPQAPALLAPALLAAGLPLAAFIFYAAGGYLWLAGVAGQVAAERLHLLFGVFAPLLGCAVNLVYAVTSRGRLWYVLLGWLCLALCALGVLAVGIAGM